MTAISDIACKDTSKDAGELIANITV
jgi:hypothetical protein